MARIAVYIPDDRLPDIEQWRAAMNFSQLFIEAFDRAIQAQTKFSKLKDEEMEAVIQRLKKSSEETFERGWKKGAKLGTESARKWLYLSHLRRIGEGSITFDKDGDDVTQWLEWHYEHVAGYRRFYSEQEEHEAALEERLDDTETFTAGQNAGFVDAVKNVWEEVRSAFSDKS